MISAQRTIDPPITISILDRHSVFTRTAKLKSPPLRRFRFAALKPVFLQFLMQRVAVDAEAAGGFGLDVVRTTPTPERSTRAPRG